MKSATLKQFEINITKNNNNNNYRKKNKQTKKQRIRQRPKIAQENKTRFSLRRLTQRKTSLLYYVHFAFMLMQAKLQVELLQARPVDSEWPVTAMRREHAGVEAVTEEAKWSAADIRGVQTSRKSKLTGCWARGARPEQVWDSVHPSAAPSGATAVFLGAHQHFAVQLLLLLFKGIFNLGSFQSSIPAKDWSMSYAPMIMYCWYTSLRWINCLSELQFSLTYTQHGWWHSLRLPNKKNKLVCPKRAQHRKFRRDKQKVRLTPQLWNWTSHPLASTMHVNLT